MKLIDLSGKRFGSLTALSRTRRDGSRATYWLCLCDCGADAVVEAYALRVGETRSCGCKTGELITVSKTRHGHSVSKSKEYATWVGIRARCFNRNNPAYHNYGGRGIAVCDQWMTFETFFADVGPCPSPAHTIDRIDNDGNYEPGNVRWATRTEQARNRRSSVILEFNGKRQTIGQWATEVGVPQQTLSNRVRRGMPLAAALIPARYGTGRSLCQ